MCFCIVIRRLSSPFGIFKNRPSMVVETTLGEEEHVKLKDILYSQVRGVGSDASCKEKTEMSSAGRHLFWGTGCSTTDKRCKELLLMSLNVTRSQSGRERKESCDRNNPSHTDASKCFACVPIYMGTLRHQENEKFQKLTM